MGDRTEAEARKRLHALVDGLPASRLKALYQSLALLQIDDADHPALVAMRDALQRGEFEELDLSEEEERRMEEAAEDSRLGRTIPHDELKRSWLESE